MPPGDAETSFRGTETKFDEDQISMGIIDQIFVALFFAGLTTRFFIRESCDAHHSAWPDERRR